MSNISHSPASSSTCKSPSPDLSTSLACNELYEALDVAGNKGEGEIGGDVSNSYQLYHEYMLTYS
jgi:hypothetical protein